MARDCGSRTMTIREACSIFLNQEAHTRKLREGTIQTYQSVLRLLLRWADANGLSVLDDLEEDALRAWVGTWRCRPSTARQRLIQLKSFFRFTADSGWATRSRLSTVRLPKSDSVPTMPLKESEMRALLGASWDQPRERALILLMRYSGLAIGDAVTLHREAVAGTELTLRRSKSGELVTVDLPDAVVRALASIPGPNTDHFWWSGKGKPVTRAKYWRARLGTIADRAGVSGFRPHRLRDTFAVSLLGQGVAMEDVSTLLGHCSIQTTERYYAPWDGRRRERLRRIVREANRADPILAGIGQ